jgi:predicted transposase YbfD/YdcC
MSDDFSLPPVPETSSSQAEVLITLLGDMDDPRVLGRVKHALPDVLFTALVAMLCGCDSFSAMGMFAQTQLGWLRTHVPLVNGAPSHDVFRNLLMLIQPVALIDILRQWAGPATGTQVCIDGKVSRGTKAPERGAARLHLLRAWVSEVGLSLGQQACGEKSNELDALPQLLASLQLQGAVVTIDAMAGHASVAQQLHEAQADYVLALKKNEKTTFENVAAYFRQLSDQDAHLPVGWPSAETLHPREDVPLNWPASLSLHRTEELNRGRYEEREVVACAVNEDWFPKQCLWYGLRSAVCVIRRTMRPGHQKQTPNHEVHYYLSSLEPQAEKLGRIIRAHWGIENSCHHVLDRTFGEDDCTVRDVPAAHNLSLLREMAMKLLKDHPLKASLRAKRQRAALSPQFRDQLIASFSPLFNA